MTLSRKNMERIIKNSQNFDQNRQDFTKLSEKIINLSYNIESPSTQFSSQGRHCGSPFMAKMCTHTKKNLYINHIIKTTQKKIFFPHSQNKKCESKTEKNQLFGM